MKTLGIVIGRFAPLHVGHEHLLREASRQCDHLLVITDVNTKRSAKNPFLDEECDKMLKGLNIHIGSIRHVNDEKTDFDWYTQVRKVIEETLKYYSMTALDRMVLFCVEGRGDDFSLRQKWAEAISPNIKVVNPLKDYNTNRSKYVSATDVREKWFAGNYVECHSLVPRISMEVMRDVGLGWLKPQVTSANHVEAEMLPKAVFVLLYANVGEHKQFLVVNRADGTLGFPGGKVEDGETLIQAAIRECQEEIGLDISTSKLYPVNGSVFTVYNPQSGKSIVTSLFACPVTFQELHSAKVASEGELAGISVYTSKPQVLNNLGKCEWAGSGLQQFNVARMYKF